MSVTEPLVDASAFTVGAMEAQEKREQQAAIQEFEQRKKEKEKDKEETRTKRKVMDKVVKGPPASVVKEQMKQQERKEERMRYETEEAEKRDIMKKIGQYVEKFPGLMSKLPRITGRISLAEAQAILTQIYEILSTVDSYKNLKMEIGFGIGLVEKFFSNKERVSYLPEPMRYDLKGITQLFMEGVFDDLDPIIVELDIEYPWLGRRNFWWRAFGAVKSIADKVHLMNTNPEAKRIFEMSQRRPVPLSEPLD